MRSRAYVSICLILVVITTGLVGPSVNVRRGSDPAVSARAQGEFTDTKMFGDTDEIKKIIIDDFDSSIPGNEVITVGRSEFVTMITGAHQTWTPKTLYQDKWLIESVDYGEFYPGHEGKELAVCGWSDWVSIVYQENGLWKGNMIFDDGDILYDVKICDIYPEHPGNEIVYVGENEEVRIGFWNGTGWESFVAYLDTYYLSNIHFGDFDAQAAGPELYVSGGSQRIIQVWYENSTWHSKVVTGAKSVRDYSSGDGLPGHPGEEIIYTAGRDCYLLYQNATVNGTGNVSYEWVNRLVYTDSKYISAVAVGDVLPEDFSPGPEIMLATRSNYGLVLRYLPETDEYLDTYPYTNPTYLTAVAVGDFDMSHPGEEAVVGGLQGRVVKVQYEKEDFGVTPLQDEVKITKGKSGSLHFIIDSLGGYKGGVRFSVEQTSKQNLEASGMSVTMSSSRVYPLGLLFVNVTTSASTTPGTYPLRLSCISDMQIEGAIRERTLNLNVTVLEKSVPNFQMKPLTFKQNIVGDFSFTSRIDISLTSGSQALVHLEHWRVPVNANATFPGSMSLTGNHNFDVVFRSTANTVPGRYIISISGRMGTGSGIIIHHVPILVDVNATGDPDFALSVGNSLVEVHKNTTGNQTVSVQSIFGFRNPVSLKLEDLPQGVGHSFSAVSVIPTTNVTLTFSPGMEAVEADHDIKLIASWAGVKKELVFMLRVLPPVPDLRVAFSEERIELNATQDQATVHLLLYIESIYDFSGDVKLELTFEHNEWDNGSVDLGYNETFFIDSLREETIKLTLKNITGTRFVNLTANVSEAGGSLYRTDTVVVRFDRPEEDAPENTEINWALVAFGIIAAVLIIALIGYLVLRSSGKLAPRDITDEDEDEEEEAALEPEKPEKRQSSGKKKKPGTKKNPKGSSGTEVSPDTSRDKRSPAHSRDK